jgi:hypothetical protein
MRKFPLFMLETVPFKLSQKPKSPQTFKQPPTLRIASEKHNPRILYPIDRTSSWFPSFKSIVRKVVKRNEIDDAFWLIDFYLDNPKSSSLKPLFVLLYELNQKRLLSTYSKNGYFFSFSGLASFEVTPNPQGGRHSKNLGLSILKFKQREY